MKDLHKIEKVKIGKVPYKIKFQENNFIQNDATIVSGQIVYNENSIVINNNSEKAQQEVTLLHEIVHGLDDAFKFNFDEDTTDKLAFALHLLIKDNNELFKALF